MPIIPVNNLFKIGTKMQIFTSTQNTFTTMQTLDLSKNISTAPTVPTDTSTQKTDTINKDAYNYFNLGQDISPYTNIDPVQEQTNKQTKM